MAAALQFFKVEPDRLLVVHDELDIPYGDIRLKLGGGEGGHNGLRSISRAIGTKDYLRARFGIGRPPGRMDPAAFVLHDFATAERKELPVLLEDGRRRCRADPGRGALARRRTGSTRGVTVTD